MRYLSIFDHNTRKRLAFLQNAYRVGYKLDMNQVWSARFTLPYDDPKNKYCQPLNYVEVYDDEEYIGLFRIIPSRIHRDSTTQEITYECEHVIATLIDDYLIKWHEIGNRGTYTNQVIQYVLNQQNVKRWTLGDCAFRHQYLYGWENENLLSAMFSIPNVFTERYRWDYDTLNYPWTLHLRANPTEEQTTKRVYNSATGQTESFTYVKHNAVAEIRYRKNMLGIEKVIDASTIVTRLYAFGYGEGENQLNISKANPTKKMYIDADTQSTYGIITQVWVDRRYQYSETLYQAAVKRLEKLKEPQVSYNVQAAYFDSLKKCKVGDIVRIIDDEDGTDLYLPLQTIEKADMTGAPNDATLTFGSLQDDAAGSVADLFDRQRVEETYSQGAVTLYSQNFADNAASGFPAEMRFYIPANVVHINEIILQGRFSAFRGYSKATKGGGATSSTTQNGGSSTPTTAAGGSTTITSESGGSSSLTSAGGGATTATSSSGGNSTVTSNSGGSSTVTSASGGGGAVTSAAGGSSTATSGSGGSAQTSTEQTGGSGYDTSASSISLLTNDTSAEGYSGSNSGRDEAYTYYAGDPSHQHKYYWPSSHSHYVSLSHHHSIPAHTHGIVLAKHTHTVNIGSHTHSVSIPSHSHSVSIPEHSHNVSIPNHTHSVSIPSHTHTVTIQNHTHSISIPSHTHSVKVPNHTHTVSIPAHSHNFSIPDHTHNIEYGIYKGTTASKGTLVVDGTTVGNYSSFDNLDLIPYLNKDSDGIVVRGWHTLQVTPDNLTRIELDLVIQLFANSRGGGQY